MAYFLRYTETANEDLNRNASFHASGLNESDASIEDVAAMFDCDEDEITMLDNGIYNNNIANEDFCYFQKLDGLCGFELESTNLEDAKKEIENHNFNSVYNSESMNGLSVIFEGLFIAENEEGCLFNAEKICK